MHDRRCRRLIERLPLLVRDGTLVVEAVDGLRGSLPFRLAGLDVDNGSEFLNDMMLRYCLANGIEFTRSRRYHKTTSLGRTEERSS